MQAGEARSSGFFQDLNLLNFVMPGLDGIHRVQPMRRKNQLTISKNKNRT
jgi:hypothetical protein